MIINYHVYGEDGEWMNTYSAELPNAKELAEQCAEKYFGRVKIEDDSEKTYKSLDNIEI